ncbi:hypothetical protein DP73_04790 [Desulfosporosinus sp. HMP52]|uniref:hypothetical protein n=1 Tax=Desulfosporosinus sp. HMP52 TaxID=1487923 RepID=UPI00051FDA78|nr:hypothetical protein [Desulfosporosinus sp. HMP52]KGK91160.1 hypothetical protein DP73_04790 [Desulfosporosinus sp. HMP52]
MSLDELCGTKNPSSLVKSNPNDYNVKVDDLIAELMRDRLIEIQTFIRLERASKQIFVNSKMIKDSGYVLKVT